MGGAVSRGIDNDDLVENLKRDDYIVTPAVEHAFRLVDRGDFFLPEDRENAYEDHAWRSGTLHMSAPCIYTKAVEALNFRPGLSFLNVGSGTGYLSTLVGTLLGPHGVNHGIEIHESNVQYAQGKVREFMKTAPEFDLTSFCVPNFVVGSGLFINPAYRSYDRVYCGAACPEEYIDFMKSLVNVGGILVVPFVNQLQRIERVSNDDFKIDSILSVSFADLILPEKEENKLMNSIEIMSEPISLQDSCRLTVLSSVKESRLNRLTELPLPKSVLPYLRCYRDAESIQRKVAEKREAADRMRAMMKRVPKKRRKSDEGEREEGDGSDSSDDGNDDEGGANIRQFHFGGPLLIQLGRLGRLGRYGIVANPTGLGIPAMPPPPPPPPEVEVENSGE
eukprot:m.16591 g.16591  ORF g.16591 m.16591 type:complete len:392 (+) comp27027_c0_seq1:99-1274(+)